MVGGGKGGSPFVLEGGGRHRGKVLTTARKNTETINLLSDLRGEGGS